ncbi:MAG TPA: hypothetical protein ENG74_00580 [Thermoplasmatales archaeon]|nr:hypothetical protein [Thermoplasmatales archaeon]
MGRRYISSTLAIVVTAHLVFLSGCMEQKAPTPKLPKIERFVANPSSIIEGENSTLSWETKNADTVWLEEFGNVGINGSVTVSPAQTKTYMLVATNKNGSMTANVTISVTPLQEVLPNILLFTASSTNVTYGDTVMISWSVINADNVTLNGIEKPSSGSENFVMTKSSTFTLIATNQYGNVTRTINITVYSPTIYQWATSANASSEYNEEGDWSAEQAIGPPDTFECGDIETAWAPENASDYPEWLALYYETPIHATGVNIHETYTPGFVYRIELIDVNDTTHIIWEGTDDTTCGDMWFNITFPITPYLVKGVIVHTQISGYEEIDAVQLVGKLHLT